MCSLTTLPPPNATQPDIQLLYSMIAKLTSQVEQQQKVIMNLTEELRSVKQAPAPATTVVNAPLADEEEFPALLPDTQFSSAPWHQPQRVLALKHNLIKNQEKREAAASRFFQAPSATQGFQYLYIPTKARIPLGKLRTTFKKLGVNNGRLLDLHYPDRNIVAVLVHNDYATELEELLTKRGIKLQTTFDPCDERVIKDPKYANESPEQRQQLARELHNQRLQKALVHIRGTAKFAVARFFAHKTWITQEQLAEALATDTYFNHSQGPTTGDIFHIDDGVSESGKSHVSAMEEDQETTDKHSTPRNSPQ